MKRRMTFTRPKKGRTRRRIGALGPFAANETVDWLEAQRDAYGLPMGRVLDACVSLARKTPDFSIPLVGRPQKPGTPTQPKRGPKT
jgi:hypothetical protein